MLTGSFLGIEADGEGVAGVARASATLSRVTAYLGGNLVRLHVGRDLKGLVPLLFKATDCLFVAAAGKSLVQLDGGDGGARCATRSRTD